jgi:tetratricopeptide (TPR) repeat protein
MRILTVILILLTFAFAHAQEGILSSVESEFKAKNYRQVIDVTEAYLKEHQAVDSVQLQLLHLKSMAYGLIEEYDSSFYTYVEILQKYPSDRITLIHMGSVFGEAGNYYSAFYFLEKLRKYHPEDPVGTLNFSFYQNELGNHEKAIAYADTTLCLAQDSVIIGSAWNNRCYANIQLGKLSEASQELKTSLSYFPLNSYAYRNLALILIEKQNHKKACDALEMARQLGGFHITWQLRKEFCEK